MSPAGIGRYLSEIQRVLKAGGRCFVTFFLLNSESRFLMRTGASTLDFGPETDGCARLRVDDPEYAVAIDESLIRHVCKQNALQLVEPIYFGSWCGRTSSLSCQDIVLLRKKL